MIRLDTVGSTNSWLMEHAAELEHGETVMAREQSAGRGQRGNSWESAPGLNLTLSVLLRPDGVEAARQFDVSCAVALGVAGMLDGLLPGHEVAIKWPNDIYVGDRKIAGILIENVLSGRLISHSVAGIGVNINQPEFFSDAPNPVSVYQLTGETHELEPLAEIMRDKILGNLSLPADVLYASYRARLWRGEGVHKWRDNLRGETFEGVITDIAPTGHITLTDTSACPRTFAFKELSALL